MWGQGLVAAHGATLQGFTLAADDGHWHWARAEIQGDTVVVSSPEVKNPRRIRYAFTPKGPWADLFNRAGRPGLCLDTGT